MPTQELILRLHAEGGKIVVDELEGVKKATKDVETATSSAGSTATKSAKGIERLHGGFSRLFGLLKTGAGLAGFGAITAIGVSAIKNSQEMGVAQAQLGASIRQAGIYTKGAQDQMAQYAERLSTAGGFATPEAIQSMSQFVRVTGDVSESQRDLALATDISRARGKDLTTVTRALMLAEQGHITGLTRLGIVVPKTASSYQALSLLQQRYAGSTAAYSKTSAGAINNLRNVVENASERLAMALAPTINKVAGAVSKFVTQMQNGTGAGGQFVKIVKDAWDALRPLVELLLKNWQVLVVLVGVVWGAVEAYKAYKAIVEIAQVAQALWTAVMIAFGGATEGAAGAAAALGVAVDALPIIGWAAAIITVIAVLLVLMVKCKAFREFIVHVFVFAFDFVKDHWKLILAAILGILTGGLALWVYLIVTHWKKIVAFLSGLPSKVEHIAIDIFKALVHGVEAVGKDIISAIIYPFKVAFDWITKNNPIAKVVHGALGVAHSIEHGVSGFIHHPFGLQSGGTISRGGVAMVGEAGPELVTLPTGSTVYPHGYGPGAGGGGDGAGRAIVALLKQLIQVEEAQLAQGQSVMIDGRQVALAMARVGNTVRAMQ